MTKIPHDDILEGLYKLRTRVSEKLKTVLDLYDLEIHQKKVVPDYHRLTTMVERVKAKHQSQLWIRDSSQDRQPKIHSTLGDGRFFKKLWCRPTKTEDFGYSF